MESEIRIKKCQCCEGLTIPEDSFYGVCDVCNWWQNPIYDKDPFYTGGANENLNLVDVKRFWNENHTKIPLELFFGENYRDERFPCPCCDQYTLEEDEENSYEICRLCGWEKESVSPGDVSGANGIRLETARAYWAKYKKFLNWETSKEAAEEFGLTGKTPAF